MIPIELSINIIYIVCAYIIFRNVRIGMNKGIANGGANLILVLLNTFLAGKIIETGFMNNNITESISLYINKYVVFLSYLQVYSFVEWFLSFLLISFIIGLFYSKIIAPFIRKHIYSNSYMLTVDKILGSCIYTLKALIICYFIIELCASPLLFQKPIDKKYIYDSIDETVANIINNN